MLIRSMEKNELSNGGGWYFTQVVKEDMPFEQRLERSEETNQAKIWRKGIPSNRNRKCKGPEAGACLGCEEQR